MIVLYCVNMCWRIQYDPAAAPLTGARRPKLNDENKRGNRHFDDD